MTCTLSLRAITPPSPFISTRAFHSSRACWERQEAARGQGTNIHPVGSPQQCLPAALLWDLLPLAVPTKGDISQERVWGFAMRLAGLRCPGKSKGVVAWCGGSPSLYMTRDPKSCSSLGVILIFNC